MPVKLTKDFEINESLSHREFNSNYIKLQGL